MTNDQSRRFRAPISPKTYRTVRPRWRGWGTAVLLVSTELDEIRALSDRIAVMFEGQIVDILPANRVTKDQLGLLMAGSRPDDLNTSDEDKPVEVDSAGVV